MDLGVPRSSRGGGTKTFQKLSQQLRCIMRCAGPSGVAPGVTGSGSRVPRPRREPVLAPHVDQPGCRLSRLASRAQARPGRALAFAAVLHRPERTGFQGPPSVAAGRWRNAGNDKRVGVPYVAAHGSQPPHQPGDRRPGRATAEARPDHPARALVPADQHMQWDWFPIAVMPGKEQLTRLLLEARGLLFCPMEVR